MILLDFKLEMLLLLNEMRYQDHSKSKSFHFTCKIGIRDWPWPQNYKWRIFVMMMEWNMTGSYLDQFLLMSRPILKKITQIRPTSQKLVTIKEQPKRLKLFLALTFDSLDRFKKFVF